jgi:hypothetical protein
MKKVPSLIYKVILVFLISALVITLWFIVAFHDAVPELTFNSIVHVFLHYGIPLSIPAVISYLIIHFLSEKVKTSWMRYAFIFIILCGMMLLMIYMFVWYLGVGLITDDLFSQ